jgi:hypothetical protein
MAEMKVIPRNELRAEIRVHKQKLKFLKQFRKFNLEEFSDTMSDWRLFKLLSRSYVPAMEYIVKTFSNGVRNDCFQKQLFHEIIESATTIAFALEKSVTTGIEHPADPAHHAIIARCMECVKEVAVI